MAILVTGGAGYIGSHIASALADAGEQVIVIDDLSTGFASVLPKSIPLVVGNCGASELVSAVLSQHDIRAVMHVAGSIDSAESVELPLRYYQNNVANMIALIESAVKAGIKKFIYSSTAAVYGQSHQTPVTEDAAKQPLTPYGWSKLIGEQILSDTAAAHGISFVALRYFNVAGAAPSSQAGSLNDAPTHLINRAARVAAGLEQKLEIYGTDYATADGTCIRDYVHVSDVAEAQLSALRYLDSGGAPTILNCGSGIGSSVLDVVAAVKRVSGRDFPAVLRSRRPGDPPSLVASLDRIHAVLGWRPNLANLDDIIRHTLLRDMKSGRVPVV